MRLALFSDVHLEHASNPTYAHRLLERLRETTEGCDVIVNAGDTHHDFSARQHVRDFLTRGRPEVTYLEVCGNHDLYGRRWDDVFNQDGVYSVDGRVFVTAPLWTDFADDPLVESEAGRFISDFRWIDGVSIDRMKWSFLQTLGAIETRKPDVVVTHFAPSPLSVHPRWNGDRLNGYFCPDALGKLTHRPKLWLHGHIHDPVDYDLDGVRVVANPVGYPGETYPTPNHYSAKIIELEG